MIDVPFGHRYIGYWEQEAVKSREDIIRVIEEHLGIDNIALSISTYIFNEPYLLFVPFDFDAEDDIRRAWDDAKRLYNYLVREGYSSYLNYSGKKGFHVYILTDPKIYSRKQLRIVQNHFKNLLSLTTVDQQIFGDIRRLMRVPGTPNIDGGLCRILAYNEGKVIDLDDFYEELELPKIKEGCKRGEGRFHDYPCIESLVRLDSEPRHLIRFAFVTLRLDEGYSPEEILAEIETFNWLDYKEDYTLKQIEHIDGRGYVPPSCDTLKEMGYCTVEECEYAKTPDQKLKDVGIL